MIQVRFTNSSGVEDYLDYSKRCHEVMGDDQIKLMLGTDGLIREVRQECDFFTNMTGLTEYLSKAQEEDEYEIIMSDETYGEMFYIRFNDRNIAGLLKLREYMTVGCTKKAFEIFDIYVSKEEDEDGVGCDEILFMCLAALYGKTFRESDCSMFDYMEFFKTIREYFYSGNPQIIASFYSEPEVLEYLRKIVEGDSDEE